MSRLKLAVAAAWFICGGCFLLTPTHWFISFGRYAFVFMVTVHLIECFVFARELRRLPGAFGEHLLHVFLFGFVHLRELRARAATGDS